MSRGVHLFAIAGAAIWAGCGGRAAEWDSAPKALFMGELRDAAVLVDTSLNRGLVITAQPEIGVKLHREMQAQELAMTREQRLDEMRVRARRAEGERKSMFLK